MPRIPRRRLGPGVFHVINRGLDRRWIFNSDEDKQWFLEELNGVGYSPKNIGSQRALKTLISGFGSFIKIARTTTRSSPYFNEKHSEYARMAILKEADTAIFRSINDLLLRLYNLK